jgi:hypothetical protein
VSGRLKHLLWSAWTPRWLPVWLRLGMSYFSPWLKSSWSMSDGQCVEVKRTKSVIFVRDSMAPKGLILSFSHNSWNVFVKSVKIDQLTISDHP